MILLIDNYDSFTFNVVHLLGDIDIEAAVVRNDKISISEIRALAPDGIIISPGPCTPNEAGICLDIIQEFSGKIPIFGICLGMQAIGQAFGGVVSRADAQFHGKTSLINHSNHAMFASIPQSFTATRYHSLIVERKNLPECLEISATVDTGEIMALAHKSHPTFGVQFHPESIVSEHGEQLLKNFIAVTQ